MGLPLSESGMRGHPSTPMADANLVRILGKQVRFAGSVDLIPLQIIEKGPTAIKQALDRLVRLDRRFAVMDAVNDRNLIDIGTACSKLKLITGGSGVAMGLPVNFRRAGALNADGGLARLPKLKGAAVVLADSCSQATRRQINRMMKNFPGFQLDPLALSESRQNVETAFKVHIIRRSTGDKESFVRTAWNPNLHHPAIGRNGSGSCRPRERTEPCLGLAKK